VEGRRRLRGETGQAAAKGRLSQTTRGQQFLMDDKSRKNFQDDCGSRLAPGPRQGATKGANGSEVPSSQTPIRKNRKMNFGF
jgi:hypothetical protein